MALSIQLRDPFLFCLSYWVYKFYHPDEAVCLLIVSKVGLIIDDQLRFLVFDAQRLKFGA